MRLDLRDRTADLKVMLASVTRHGHLLAFSPSVPELWFDVRKGESLEARAQEVYTAYFRRQRKEDPSYEVARHSIEGKAWVDHVTIDVLPQVRSKQPIDPLRAVSGRRRRFRRRGRAEKNESLFELDRSGRFGAANWR